MPLEQIMDVPENGQPTIQLPGHLIGSRKVKVVIAEIDDEREAKIALLKHGADDPIFLSDKEEVSKDFEDIENNLDE